MILFSYLLMGGCSCAFLPSNSQTSISEQKLPVSEDVANEDRKLAALALTTATDEGTCVLHFPRRKTVEASLRRAPCHCVRFPLRQIFCQFGHVLQIFFQVAHVFGVLLSCVQFWHFCLVERNFAIR